MMANYREAEWHPDIPITYAVIDYRRWHPGITWHDPYKSKTIQLDKSKPHGPWIYTWGNLRPFTMVDIRVRFGNRYGIGNVSDWQHDYSEWGGRYGEKSTGKLKMRKIIGSLSRRVFRVFFLIFCRLGTNEGGKSNVFILKKFQDFV